MATPVKRTSAAKKRTASKKSASPAKAVTSAASGAAGAVSDAASGAADAVTDAAGAVADTAQKATRKVTKAARKATASAKAVRAARAGRVEDARELVQDADLDDTKAAEALAAAEALHYQVEVNKRGLSVTALTKTLNERWDNGWKLAHILEQRGNTVLVFEKRQ